MHGALRQPHRFVQVAFAWMNGVQPCEIICSKDRVLVMCQRFAIVIDRRVDVLSIHLEHANQSVCGSVVRTMLDNFRVLCNGALLLVRIHEQSAQCRIGSEVVGVDFQCSAELRFRALRVSLKAVGFALQKMESRVIRLRANRLIDSRVRLVDPVLRCVEIDETAERIKVRAIDGQCAVIETDCFIDLVFCERYRSEIYVNVGTLRHRVVRHHEILARGFGVAQLQCCRALRYQRVGLKISEHLRRCVLIGRGFRQTIHQLIRQLHCGLRIAAG